MSDLFEDSFYKKHPLFNLAGDVKEICRPFFQAMNVNYFDYIRFYNNQSFVGLVSDAEWVEHFFRRNFALGCTLKDSGIHLWQAYHHDPLLQDAKIYFKHDNGISIFYKKEDYIEYFDFAASPENKQILSVYFNNYDIIQKFCEFFLIESKKLISQVEVNPIIIPKKMCAELIPDQKISDKALFGKHKINLHCLTPRQKDCLIYLSRGMTMKQIANTLNLSPKTVEHYLDTVKDKLNCYTRWELIQKAQRLGV